MSEQANEVRGFLVVSMEEGAQLGTVTDVYVSRSSAQVVAFAFRRGNIFGRISIVPTDCIERVGRDVLLISAEGATHTLRDPSDEPGRSLKALQGLRVTTESAAYLGTLVDLEFSPKTWKLTSLTLTPDLRLPVRSEDVTIGDEIILPAEYEGAAQRIDGDSPGFLRRILGSEAIEQVRGLLQRTESTPPREREKSVGAAVQAAAATRRTESRKND